MSWKESEITLNKWNKLKPPSLCITNGIDKDSIVFDSSYLKRSTPSIAGRKMEYN